jgi:Protein of unknown function (DUF3417)
MRKNPRRILSPQRLPFRHPGRGTTNLSNRTSSCNTSACVKPLARCHKVPAMEMIFPLRKWWPQSRASARKHRSSRRAGIRGARRFLPGALKRCPESLEGYLSSKSTWYRREHSAANKDFPVAYFSAEFGVTECLPIFAGGLGVLAGDHLKASSDLGLPDHLHVLLQGISLNTDLLNFIGNFKHKTSRRFSSRNPKHSSKPPSTTTFYVKKTHPVMWHGMSGRIRYARDWLANRKSTNIRVQIRQNLASFRVRKNPRCLPD